MPYQHDFAASARTDGGTGSQSINTPTLSELRQTAAQLNEDVGGHRSVAKVLHEDFDDLHHKTSEIEWRTGAAQRAKSSVLTMLNELAELGFAWRDIAQLVHVSVPAVQKWRKGEKASGESRQRLASFLSACDLVTNDYLVEDIASWFEMPLVASVPITSITLYAADRADLVFEHANGHADPEAILTQFDPDWREIYRSDFEIFEAGDGHESIRMKD